MPSPFPGMDPYLENPEFWPDFHDRLSESISAILNQQLPPQYFAQLGVREQISVVGEEHRRGIVPDVTVQQFQWGPSNGGTAVIEASRTELSAAVEIETDEDTVSFVEIRAQSNHEVVTVIEILSPSNKCWGPDREAYVEKRRSVLSSQTSLIEIDLLRRGDRSIFGFDVTEIAASCLRPEPDYVVLVHVGWRKKRSSARLYPVSLHEALPVMGVPLSESEPLLPFDLQRAFRETYDRGPYRRGAIDYLAPPHVPLTESLQQWADDCLARGKS